MTNKEPDLAHGQVETVTVSATSQPPIAKRHRPSDSRGYRPRMPTRLSLSALEDDSSRTITITSFDPANPGSQDVVFFKETASGSTGKATLWVAWDFLTTAYGRERMLSLVTSLLICKARWIKSLKTNTYYFGNYVNRPGWDDNIDVMDSITHC